MPNILSTATDTIRTVDWDELPNSVKKITPDNLDQLLLENQSEWISIKTVLKVAEKGRRTGITYAEAWDAALTASCTRAAGGMDVYYIGDTKDKGLEFIGYVAQFSKFMAEISGEVSEIEEFFFEDQETDPVTGKVTTRQISAYRARFASGFKVVALSSNPANIRGLQGRVVIDEAAFHANVDAVIEAATALLIWGGEIRIISTHNGKSNPFNQLIKDIRAGLYGEDAVVYRCTFDDAVKNGLYERVCTIKGEKPTPEGKKKWYNRIRNAYGPRKAAMREELDAIPRDGSGVAIPSIWVENAMPEERPVLRLALDDDFAKKHEDDRMSWGLDWIKQNLNPVLLPLNDRFQHVFGMDFARHRHFSVIEPAFIAQNLKRIVPFIIELHNVPTRQQEQILWAMIEGLPKFSGGAIDATGPGQTLAEYTADRYGESIHQVNLSRKWYAEEMRPYVDAFEDGVIELPKDANILEDHRAVTLIDGIPMVPKMERNDLKEPDLVRHGDSAVSGAMMWFASRNLSTPIEFQSTGRRQSIDSFQEGYRESLRQTDTGFGTVGGRNDFGGYS